MNKHIQQLINILGPWKWHYISSSLLLLMAVLIRTLEPKVLQVAVDNVVAFSQSGGSEGQFGADAISRAFQWLLPAVNMNNLGWVLICLGLIYIGIAVLRGGFFLGANALTATSTEKAMKRLRDRLFWHIQHLPLSHFNKITRGELIQRCTGDISTIRAFVLNQIVEVIRLTAIFIFSFTMMAIVSWKFALIAVALMPIILIMSYIFFKKEKKVWEAHEAEADKLNNMVQENLNGIRLVQAFANEEYEKEQFDAQNKRKLNIGLKHVDLHVHFWPISDLLVFGQFIISVLAGGYFAIIGELTLGQLVSFYAYIWMVSWPMRQAARVLSQMGMAVVAMNRISEILNAPIEADEGTERTVPIKGAITFHNVHFAYGEEQVLNGISFRINPGEKVALVGATGAGKSTIIHLLTRLYAPDTGSITIDDEPIEAFAKPYLRKAVGVVMQKPFLFSTTVKENMAYINTEADGAAIEQAAAAAQVDRFKEVLVNGYETVVGEKGVTLSGGQKQRVALARTLLSVPDVLVLDDVTSAVDTQTEHAIFKALEEYMHQKTTIIISHRITSIQQADRILVIDAGKVVQEGTHEQLVTQEGYYKEIHTLQAVLEKEISAIG